MGLLFVAKGAERNHKKHIRHKEVTILVPFAPLVVPSPCPTFLPSVTSGSLTKAIAATAVITPPIRSIRKCCSNKRIAIHRITS